MKEQIKDTIRWLEAKLVDIHRDEKTIKESIKFLQLFKEALK